MNFRQDIEGRYTRRGAEVGENGGGNTRDPDKVERIHMRSSFRGPSRFQLANQMSDHIYT